MGLPVIACAINRYINLKAIENRRSCFKIDLPDISQSREISIGTIFNQVDYRDYFASSLKTVRRYGCIPDKGFDIEIKGNLPVNAGVSSSSALIIAWIRFLVEAYGIDQAVTPVLISRMAYEAEVLEHNEPGGLMDQYSIGIGNVLFIGTGEKASHEMIQEDVKGLIVGESGVKKETISTLGNLKAKALTAIEYVTDKNPDFRIESAMLNDYDRYEKYVPLELKPIFFAALKNYDITLKALNEFRKENPNMKYIGSLMNEHHLILKNILKVTVPRIDKMVENALKAGAYGVKIVGSGGGGSIVAIAPEEKEQKVIESILQGGGKAAYKVQVDQGARVVL